MDPKASVLPTTPQRPMHKTFCTFLDASKAFDRVNYCKLFRLLIKRDLPACIIRVLINMYILAT